MIVTRHAEQRIRERVGLPKRVADKAAARALSDGVRRTETTGRLRRYLDALYHARNEANNIRVWADKVYLFHNVILITVLNLPNDYKNAYKKIQERRRT